MKTQAAGLGSDSESGPDSESDPSNPAALPSGTSGTAQVGLEVLVMVKVDQRTLQVVSISSNQTRFCCSSTVMQGLVLILGLLVLVCSPHVEPRVQLNSIRTVVLREGPAVPANRSSWESSLDLKVRAPRLHQNGRLQVQKTHETGQLTRTKTEHSVIHVRV